MRGQKITKKAWTFWVGLHLTTENTEQTGGRGTEVNLTGAGKDNEDKWLAEF